MKQVYEYKVITSDDWFDMQQKIATWQERGWEVDDRPRRQPRSYLIPENWDIGTTRWKRKWWVQLKKEQRT